LADSFHPSVAGQNLSLFPAGKAICGTGVLSTGETGAGCKDGNGERAEGAIHGHQANEGGNKEADRQRVKPMFFHPIPFVRRAIRYCFFTAVKNSF